METSRAVLADYVDMSNLDRVENGLQFDSLVDSQAGELLTELQSDRLICAHDLCEEQTMFSLILNNSRQKAPKTLILFMSDIAITTLLLFKKKIIFISVYSYTCVVVSADFLIIIGPGF